MTRCDELEREIAAMESRLFEVKVTMDAEAVNWKRANKLNKKSGTHWRNAKPNTPPTAGPVATVPFGTASSANAAIVRPPVPRHKSLNALEKQSAVEWSVADVSSWLHHMNHDGLVGTCNEFDITGDQLMYAHMGLSDVNLRRLFRVQHGDLHWKRFVYDVAALHRDQAARVTTGRAVEPPKTLPALSPRHESNQNQGSNNPLPVPQRPRRRPQPAAQTVPTSCAGGCGKVVYRKKEDVVHSSSNGLASRWFCSPECHRVGDHTAFDATFEGPSGIDRLHRTDGSIMGMDTPPSTSKATPRTVMRNQKTPNRTAGCSAAFAGPTAKPTPRRRHPPPTGTLDLELVTGSLATASSSVVSNGAAAVRHRQPSRSGAPTASIGKKADKTGRLPHASTRTGGSHEPLPLLVVASRQQHHPSVVAGGTQPSPSSRAVLLKPSAATYCKYRMDDASAAAPTLMSVFLSTIHVAASHRAGTQLDSDGPPLAPPTLLCHLLAFLRLPAWCRLTTASSAWRHASQTQDDTWKVFFDQVWVRAVDGAIDATAHAVWVKKRHNYRRTMHSLSKQVATIAADNVHLLVQPETWQLANEAQDDVADIQRFAVGSDRGNVVAAVVPAFPTQLIQTLVPEATTMGVLHGLASRAYTSVTVRRLKIFNSVHVPPLDTWPTFVNHPLVSMQVATNDDDATALRGKSTTLESDVHKFQAAVIALTGRRLRAKLKADATDRLAKRAKKDVAATAALAAIVHPSKLKASC